MPSTLAMPKLSMQRLVGPQHQQLQRIGHRRDEAQRLERARVGGEEDVLQRLGVLAEAQVAGDVPAGDDEQAQHQAAHDLRARWRGSAGP
jgi:hypothetical protein